MEGMNDIRICFLLIMGLLCSVFPAASQEAVVTDSLKCRFERQLAAFPQEKIYLQTDKSNYLSGERVWFRAHVVDALTHRPVFISRYVYVEVINPLDDLVQRVKVRPDSTGIYAGYIDLEEDLPEGNYTLRSYTQYMRNMGDDAFFRKSLRVLDPFSLQIDPVVHFHAQRSQLNGELLFVDRQTGDTVLPEQVSCKIGRSGLKSLKPYKGTASYQWEVSVPEKEPIRAMLLGIIYKGRKYNRFFSVPHPETDFVLSFFPEGGYLIPGTVCQVAYKALNSNGLGEDVSGTLYDAGGREIVTFETVHLGMGFFNFIPVKGERYYAVCTNRQGLEKRFELPASEAKADLVSVRSTGSRLIVSHKRGAEAPDGNFSLLIHHKGRVLYHEPWDRKVEWHAFLSKDFPYGILDILLLNEKEEIVSERLVFNVNDSDLAQIRSEGVERSYKRREKITVNLKLTDGDAFPLSGNIALSVTDKASVVRDTTVSLLSTLLLSSELKGHIESPESYFDQGKIKRSALDALMLTQGWKRYDVAAMAGGEIVSPDLFEPELSQKVTGNAEGLFGPLKKGEVSLLATLDTLVSTQVVETDDDGRFVFRVEYPEKTAIVVQSRSKKGGSMNQIHIDKESFPELQNAALPASTDRFRLSSADRDAYLVKADEAYAQKNGIRTVMLQEVVVTAKGLEKYKESSFYSPIYASRVQTAEDIEKMGVTSLRSLLYRQPGIIVRSNSVTTTRSEMPVLFVIDDIRYEDFYSRLDDIDVSAIESIFVLKDNVSMAGHFPNTSGAVVISTKRGNYNMKMHRPPSIDHIIPLGYQQPAEFYVPRYETFEQKENSLPDLRTTLYWKPNLLFSDQGEATIEFYAADTPTVYQMIGEGVSDEGKPIRYQQEVVVERTIR